MDKKETCEWWDEDGVWYSSCGVVFEFTCDGPKENEFHFCYKCGLPIEVNPVAPKED